MKNCITLAILLLLGQPPAHARDYMGGPLSDCPEAKTPDDKIKICAFHIDGVLGIPKQIRALAVSDAELSYLHAVRGEAYLNKRAWGPAIADLDEAIKLDPTPGAYVLRAIALHEAGDPAKAIKDATRAIDLAPSSQIFVAALKVRALSLVATKQPRLAIGDLKRAHELNAADVGILMLEARAHEAIGERQAALECYDAALRINPKLDAALDAAARLSLDAAFESIERTLKGQ
jgi:tetratricopeptide (TPR) repeat protein